MVVYSRYSSREKSLDIKHLTKALELIVMWDFRGLETSAFSKLDRLLINDPARRVAIAYKFTIKAWFIQGVNALARREEPMGLADLEIMGPECTLKVAQVRERYSHPCVKCNAKGVKTAKSRAKTDFTRDIKDVFF